MSLLLASLLAAQAAPAQPAPAAAPDYRTAASWLCLPGRKDVCATPLPTTALTRNGYGSTGLARPAASPKLDCFYVYPTVSQDKGFNSDLTADLENGAAMSQFARFGSVCRTFAPLYRQMTTSAIGAAALGRDPAPWFNIAYGDVRAAFRNFLATRSGGRPFVLVGHSQGSWLLQRLIAEEVEGKPAARQMALAIIPGFNTLVPEGKLTGGTFKSTPLCTKPGQRGCVVTYVSYRTNNPPPPGALFGHAAGNGMTVACTNPAALGSRNWASLDSYWTARSNLPVPGGPIRWSTDGTPPTPFLRTEGLASGRCVNDGPRGYLEIRTNVTPGAKWTDRIGGEVGIGGLFIPGWGMHLADMSAPQGDLIRLVEAVAR
ncbi:DUF3089 domain-containing protein [Sphingomonas sp. LHG3406-1]|uniref:DUF3089 domain-containing protein n=1 Tax=Sphingomonas sp. LHG3406-1 TaxID=2804617 RepID=UPI00262907AB|nr:DUF3089 domain-containing protein [Sphingomonas sp. LHG3406-1]